jgi:hypothetical protein
MPGAPGGAPMGAPMGAPGTVDIGAGFTWAWTKFQANLQPLLILGAIVGGVPVIIYIISSFTSGFIVQNVLWLLGLAAGIVLSILTIQAGLEVANTGTLNQATMFQLRANVGNYIIGALIFTGLAILGCFLLCIGLLFVYLIFGLWSYAVVDEGASGVGALTRSKDLVMGPGLGNTFVPMLVFLIFNAGGGFLGRGFGFGGLVSVFLAPFGGLIGAYIWKGLKGEPVAA